MPPHDVVIPELHTDAPPPGTRIGPHYHRCFGCGDRHPTGLHMQLVVGEGLTMQAEFTVTEDHQGAPGLAHGGLLTAALDEALGSLAWLLRTTAVTGRLETEFLRPVPVGTTLFLTVRGDGVKGRRIYAGAEGRMDHPEGELAVRAAAVFVTVGLEHFVAHGRAEDVRAAMGDERAAAARGFEVNP